MSHEQQVDVIIVGAGMVGASIACALANSSLSIALLDSSEPSFDWPTDGFVICFSAITHATQQFLDSLGAWAGIEAERVSPFREMHVWDATGQGVIHFDSAEIGEATLGHIIENRVIVKALHQQVALHDNIELIAPVRANALELQDEQVSLQLEDGRSLTAKLLIGADGSRSWVRQQAGISVRGWDYDQSALVTYVKTAKPHQETAWQRFLPDGPLAFLPLSEGYSSIVWSTSPQHAQQLCEMEEARFAMELQASFEHKLGAVERVGPRAVFPLRFFETNAYVKPRLALLGDAAHTIHPLAGQGVNLGMADAEALAQVLLQAFTEHKDVGAMKVLRRYERWRRADNRSMLMTMDAFKRLFSSELTAVRWARNLGLGLTNQLTPVKNLIMRKAMGYISF